MDKELWDAILDGLTLRELQKEAARAKIGRASCRERV